MIDSWYSSLEACLDSKRTAMGSSVRANAIAAAMVRNKVTETLHPDKANA